MQLENLSTRLWLVVLGLITVTALVACDPRTTGLPPLAAPTGGPILRSTISSATVETPTLPASGSTTPARDATRPAESALPDFSHIYMIVMENREYGSVVGSTDVPYLNSLTAQYGLATNYTAVAHPSEPNYIALFSGSTQGVTTDGVYDLNGKNLADQIEAAGKTWRVLAENVPTACFTGGTARNGVDGSGTYARKHNPAISFTGISRSPARCGNITDFTHFDPAMANYALIVPNLCHDMHDCSAKEGDDFLKGFVPKILNSRAWQDGGVLFIVWDEGSTQLGGGGRVPLLVISNRVPKGFRSSVTHTHYSLLRTIQDAWGLACLDQSCAANNLDEFFR